MNRKQILSSATIAALAGILLAWAPSAAYAGGGGGGGGFESPATVAEGWGCGIGPSLGGPGFTTDTHSIINKKFTKITCHFTGLTPQDPALINRGFACGTFAGGVTTDTMMVVDDEGNGMLRCIIHNT